MAAETLVDSADVIGAMSCDALKGTDAAFDERIQKLVRMRDRYVRPPIFASCWREARFANRIAIVGAYRTRIRCGAYRKCMARCVTRWRIAARCSRSR